METVSRERYRQAVKKIRRQSHHIKELEILLEGTETFKLLEEKDRLVGLYSTFFHVVSMFIEEIKAKDIPREFE